MAYTTITVSEEAYKRLKGLKHGRDSFTEVILRHIHQPARTGEEMIERLKEIDGEDLEDKDLMDAVIRGRGRRSKRHAR